MRRRVLVAAAALALVGAGTATAQDCTARLEAIAQDFGDFFSERNTTFLNNQPVLRDLRNAAVRLEAQGLQDACVKVVEAMQDAIESYQAQAGETATAEPQVGPEKVEEPADAPATVAQAEQSAEAAAALDQGKPVPMPEKIDGRLEQDAADLEARLVSFVDSDVVRDTSQVDGAGVFNFDNERIGHAEGLLLTNGQPTHLVIDHGGFWAFGKSRIAIPVAIVRWDPQLEHFVIAVRDEDLEGAPVYDPEDEAWTAQANDEFYASLAR